MRFGDSTALALFVAVGVLVVVSAWYVRWQGRARASFGGAGTSGRGTRGITVATLTILAAVLIVLAAARPLWGTHEFRRESKGVDLVLILDISTSMTAQDVQPSRLGVAQTDLSRLVESMPGNRTGLVFFAGSAIIRSPLSTDTGALADIIRSSERETGLIRTGSDIGAALDLATTIFDSDRETGRAVLVVSDGEDFGSTAADSAARLHAAGITVYTAGVGTAAGGTMPETVPALRVKSPLKVDAAGKPLITHANEAALQKLATAGGGTYFRLSGSPADLAGFRDNLAQLQQSPLVADTQRVPVERFQWFAGAAFALLLVAWLLPSGFALRMPRLRRPVRVLRPAQSLGLLFLAVLLAASCGGDATGSGNATANRLFAEGKYDEALQRYESLLTKRPDLPELAYNAGNALDRLGKFDRAVDESRRALPPTSVDLGEKTYFSLGNHFLGFNRPQEAVDAYRSALLLDPADTDAKYNYELALRMLQSQQQQAPNQGSQPPPSGQPNANQNQPPAGRGGDPSEAPDQPPQPAAGAGQGAPNDNGAPGAPTAAQAQRSLEQALAGINDNPSVEDAIHVLDLLQQLNAAQRNRSPATPGGGPDY